MELKGGGGGGAGGRGVLKELANSSKSRELKKTLLT